MYFEISNAIKKRLVLIFEDILRDHPLFKDKVDVYTKFPDEERPKHAILVRSVSGGSQRTGLANFAGIHRGRTTLANFKAIPGTSIEWVRDDTLHLKNRAAPGFYVVKIVSGDPTYNAFKFVVEPYLLIDDEVLDIQIFNGNETAFLKNTPVNPNTEKIFTDDGVVLRNQFDYTMEYDTGKITFVNPVVDELGELKCDYQFIDNPSDEYDISMYELNNVSIPGVIMAFTDRINVGDEQVVVVERELTQVANIYSGRWSLSIDVNVVSQDPDQQERLVDYVVTKLWSQWEPELINEGIYFHDYSLSGEAEDLEVDIPEEYNFTAGISFNAEVDWEVHMPIITEVRAINILYGTDEYKNTLNNLDRKNYEDFQYTGKDINAKHQIGVQIVPSTEPIVTNPTMPIKVSRKY